MYVCLAVSSCALVRKNVFHFSKENIKGSFSFFPNQSSCHFDLSEVYVSLRVSESEKLLGEIFMRRTEGYKLLPRG